MTSRKKTKAYLILEFADARQKAAFVGGLLDGWGEGAPIETDWDYTTLATGESVPHAGAAPLLRVRVIDEDV